MELLQAESFSYTHTRTHSQDKGAFIFLCKAIVVDELVIFSWR